MKIDDEKKTFNLSHHQAGTIQIRSTHSVDDDEDEEEESTTTSTFIVNQSKYCLSLQNDNETTSSSREIDFLDDIQLLVCEGAGDEEQTGDIEKQLHKSLVRVIGETNLIKLHTCEKKDCDTFYVSPEKN